MIRRLVVATLGVLSVAGAAWWFSTAQADPSVEAALWRAAGVTPMPGSIQAPGLRLNDLSGHLVDLGQFRGRLVMVYFWATW